LPAQLRARGAEVDVLPVYETLMDGAATESFRAQLEQAEFDVLTFTASSTVHNFMQALTDTDGILPGALIGATVLAAIGPVTADALREHGLEPNIVAAEHTIPGLVAAIERHFAGTPGYAIPNQS
jgi:uroporphyrinogen III methyltransferase/synthase